MQQDRLLNLRLLDEIYGDTFASKSTELRDRIAAASLRVEAAKRQLLEIVFSNFVLDGATLCYEVNKPFDVLIEGLEMSQTRGDWTPVELFLAGIRVFDPATCVWL